jgi:3-dehydroquinate dehydratase
MYPAAVGMAQKTSVALQDSVAEVDWSVLNLHLLDQYEYQLSATEPFSQLHPAKWWSCHLVAPPA